ncbi:MAG: hypothetical protein E5V67_13355 [Mesorhizobium sp.]|nr:MAG: hypothetical protein EOS41_23205 [Mesorhizobium sp.]TGQ19243.1 hypothetical protein EN860_021670 [Mesorhizobium sp. M00.F.Ca.ET.217.01.1.1]TGV90156.1 hypothetical protein EN801_019995 [Mesorhizobium sp. M00.F.Ca.ET.158.01.1.1]TIU87629.1 MAG: hypothetical protein E5W06_05200 [Mesorhizobium sp.]TIW22715.1 MAG: hypothetical protein E5V65_03250 [Mesorhizobium sp.]
MGNPSRRGVPLWRQDGHGQSHFTIYMRFLDAAADNASYEEMADLILGIDPEPERARNAARSHLDRANWMVDRLQGTFR